MKKAAALSIPLLVFLTACSLAFHTGDVRLTVKNAGRFDMCVNVYNASPNYSMDTKLVPSGETAVWMESRYLSPGIKTFVNASYSDDWLDKGGYWQTSFDVSVGDDIKLTIPGCPGWDFMSPCFSRITYGNGLFVALGGTYVYWSPDGTSFSWNPARYPWGGHDIAFGNDRFVVVSSSYYQARWTTDVAAGEWSDSNTGVWSPWCVAYGNGRFVVNGAWSPDGTAGSWAPTNTGMSSYDIAYGNDRFVTVGENGEAAWSPDGTAGSWTKSSVFGSEMVGVAYGNGRFVAVGYDGKAACSPDGTAGTWTESSACARSLFHIAFGNSRFVAVGDGGEIVWSPDGSPGSWTESRPGDPVQSNPLQLTGIAYGHGRFVAVGNGRMMSSPDGSAGSWTEIQLYE